MLKVEIKNSIDSLFTQGGTTKEKYIEIKNNFGSREADLKLGKR